MARYPILVDIYKGGNTRNIQVYLRGKKTPNRGIRIFLFNFRQKCNKVNNKNLRFIDITFLYMEVIEFLLLKVSLRLLL